MDFKLIFLIISVVLVSTQPIVFGEINELKTNQRNLEIGQIIQSDRIILEIEKSEKIHVKHFIEFGSWDTNKSIKILSGEHSNLKVADEDGDNIGHGISGETFADSEYVVMKQKLGCCDVVIEYDLENFMILKDDLWFKEIGFPHDVEIVFSDDIELIFVNSRAVDISDAKGINCIGCGMTLEFLNQENIKSYELSKEEIVHKLDVISNGEIDNLRFIKHTNTIEFEIKKENQLLVMDIPFDIILNPYKVYLTEKNDMTLDQMDQIRKSEFAMDEDSGSVTFRPYAKGIVSILGATEDEHQKKLEQQEKMIQGEVEEKLEGTSIMDLSQDQSGMIDNTSNKEIFEEWGKSNSNITEEPDYTIIFIILGIIAVVIIGIIIKTKKN